MRPDQANPAHRHPGHGNPPPARPQPFGAPVRLRANAVASVIAGSLALLSAGLVTWFAVADMVQHDSPEPWPNVVVVNVVGGFATAVVLWVVAVFTFARTVGGAWTLAGVTLLVVILNVISPLLRGADFGAHLDFVFGFHKPTGVAIGLTTIFAALTAIAATAAATAKRP